MPKSTNYSYQSRPPVEEFLHRKVILSIISGKASEWLQTTFKGRTGLVFGLAARDHVAGELFQRDVVGNETVPRLLVGKAEVLAGQALVCTTNQPLPVSATAGSDC